jgi:hypothetical protein
VSAILNSVAEPHPFYVVAAPRGKYDAAPAPAPTLLYTKPTFFSKKEININSVAELKRQGAASFW